MAARGHRPLLLIDIAVPRDIEHACAEIEGVTLYDIDDLQRVVARNLEVRAAERSARGGDRRGGAAALRHVAGPARRLAHDRRAARARTGDRRARAGRERRALGGPVAARPRARRGGRARRHAAPAARADDPPQERRRGRRHARSPAGRARAVRARRTRAGGRGRRARPRCARCGAGREDRHARQRAGARPGRGRSPSALGGAELVPITTTGDRGAGDGQGALGRGDRRGAAARRRRRRRALGQGRAGAARRGPGDRGHARRAQTRATRCAAPSLDALARRAGRDEQSLRREALLRALRPDLDVVELRGNVDTRLRKLAEDDARRDRPGRRRAAAARARGPRDRRPRPRRDGARGRPGHADRRRPRGGRRGASARSPRSTTTRPPPRWPPSVRSCGRSTPTATRRSAPTRSRAARA